MRFQKERALDKWYQSRTEGSPKLRKPMVVALARELLLALWRLVMVGDVPDGVVLRPA
ncbi:MAG: hypothetical protein ACR2Q4_05185 [Geminicoccaceae bacterium]